MYDEDGDGHADTAADKDYPAYRAGLVYAIEVKQKAGIPLREYLWQDTSKTPNVCFEYGETEWITGRGFADIEKDPKYRQTCPAGTP